MIREEPAQERTNAPVAKAGGPTISFLHVDCRLAGFLYAHHQRGCSSRRTTARPGSQRTCQQRVYVCCSCIGALSPPFETKGLSRSISPQRAQAASTAAIVPSAYLLAPRCDRSLFASFSQRPLLTTGRHRLGPPPLIQTCIVEGIIKAV